MEPITIILAVVSAVVFGVLGFVIGGVYRKKVAEAKIGSANEEALIRQFRLLKARKKRLFLRLKTKYTS